jgi:hypothetical protein
VRRGVESGVVLREIVLVVAMGIPSPYRLSIPSSAEVACLPEGVVLEGLACGEESLTRGSLRPRV